MLHKVVGDDVEEALRTNGDGSASLQRGGSCNVSLLHGDLDGNEGDVLMGSTPPSTASPSRLNGMH
jgi:hypothetical protein